MSAVGVEDGGHDAVAVVDGLDPLVGIYAGCFDVDDLYRAFGEFGAAKVRDQRRAVRAPGSGENGDGCCGFRG